MFVVTEADAAAIRAIFHQQGEFAAAVELRRLFPGISDADQAREWVRIISSWRPLVHHGAPPDRLITMTGIRTRRS